MFFTFYSSNLSLTQYDTAKVLCKTSHNLMNEVSWAAQREVQFARKELALIVSEKLVWDDKCLFGIMLLIDCLVSLRGKNNKSKSLCQLK